MTRAQRFSLTLDRAIADEASLLDELQAWPQARRQREIRLLLARGMKALKVGKQLGNPFGPSGEGKACERVVIHLQPLAPDDCEALDALDKVAPSRQNRWLMQALVTGLLLRRPDIDLSDTKDQDLESVAVTKPIEIRHLAEQPEGSIEDVDDVPAPAEQTESGRPKLLILNELFK